MRSVDVLISAGLLASSPLSAQSVDTAATSVVALHGSSLTIRGSTTIGAPWYCTATDIDASAGLHRGARVFSAEAVRSVLVSVPVYMLRCQSRAMERAMRKAMRADKDSTSSILGRFATHPRTEGTDGSSAHFDGALTVAGVERPVVFDVSIERMSQSVQRVQSTVPLTLSAFDITPPGVLWGAIRARDAITVEVDLRFARGW